MLQADNGGSQACAGMLTRYQRTFLGLRAAAAVAGGGRAEVRLGLGSGVGVGLGRQICDG